MLVAVKLFHKDKMGPTSVKWGVSILKDLHHPNIIQPLAVSERSTNVFLTMECARSKRPEMIHQAC